MAIKRSIDKQLLSNYLRHADGHNKIHEEQEMWRARALEIRRERVFEDLERKTRQPPLVRGHLLSDVRDADSRSCSSTPPPPSSSDQRASQRVKALEGKALCKQLMKMEERDPFRWGHAGFKELYPDEFTSGSEEGSGESGNDNKRKSKKSHSRKRKREQKETTKTKRRKLKTKEDTSPDRKFRKAKKRSKRKRVED